MEAKLNASNLMSKHVTNSKLKKLEKLANLKEELAQLSQVRAKLSYGEPLEFDDLSICMKMVKHELATRRYAPEEEIRKISELYQHICEVQDGEAEFTPQEKSACLEIITNSLRSKYEILVAENKYETLLSEKAKTTAIQDAKSLSATSLFVGHNGSTATEKYHKLINEFNQNASGDGEIQLYFGTGNVVEVKLSENKPIDAPTLLPKAIGYYGKQYNLDFAKNRQKYLNYNGTIQTQAKHINKNQIITGLAWCRHLAFTFILNFASKKYKEIFSTKENCTQYLTDPENNRFILDDPYPYADTYKLFNVNDGSLANYLYDLATVAEKNQPVLAMISSFDHAMAITLIKQDDGCIIKFYDPNRSSSWKNFNFSDLETIKDLRIDHLFSEPKFKTTAFSPNRNYGILMTFSDPYDLTINQEPKLETAHFNINKDNIHTLIHSMLKHGISKMSSTVKDWLLAHKHKLSAEEISRMLRGLAAKEEEEDQHKLMDSLFYAANLGKFQAITAFMDCIDAVADKLSPDQLKKILKGHGGTTVLTQALYPRNKKVLLAYLEGLFKLYSNGKLTKEALQELSLGSNKSQEQNRAKKIMDAINEADNPPLAIYEELMAIILDPEVFKAMAAKLKAKAAN